MSALLVAATVGLMALPALTRVPARKLRPEEWARLSALALALGASMLEVALVVCALPLIPDLRAAGGRAIGSRHFFPGGDLAGWLSAMLAIAFLTAASSGALRCLRTRQRMRSAARMGRLLEGYRDDVLVLPTARPVALALPGGKGTIMLSDAVVTSLSRDQLEAVIRHERAHLIGHHSRYLLLAAALGSVLRPLPILRRSVTVLRLALERWADEEAAGGSGGSRRAVRDALLTLAWWEADLGVATFSGLDSVVERVQALEVEPVTPARSWRLVIYVSLAGLALLSTVPLVVFMG